MLTCKEVIAIFKSINHFKFLNVIQIDITEKAKALGPSNSYEGRGDPIKKLTASISEKGKI